MIVTTIKSVNKVTYPTIFCYSGIGNGIGNSEDLKLIGIWNYWNFFVEKIFWREKVVGIVTIIKFCSYVLNVKLNGEQFEQAYVYMIKYLFGHYAFPEDRELFKTIIDITEKFILLTL